MTLVRFCLSSSVHNTAVFYYSERDVLTSSLVFCLVRDDVYSHGIHTKHEYNYNIHILHNDIGCTFIDTVTSLCSSTLVNNFL